MVDTVIYIVFFDGSLGERSTSTILSLSLSISIFFEIRCVFGFVFVKFSAVLAIFIFYMPTTA